MTETQTKTAARIKPLGDLILIKRNEAEKVTAAGIHLPEMSQDKPHQGTVLAVGPGKWTENGARIPVEVEVGQSVVFSRYTGTEIKLDGEHFWLIPTKDLLATVDGEVELIQSRPDED